MLQLRRERAPVAQEAPQRRGERLARQAVLEARARLAVPVDVGRRVAQREHVPRQLRQRRVQLRIHHEPEPWEPRGDRQGARLERRRQQRRLRGAPGELHVAPRHAHHREEEVVEDQRLLHLQRVGAEVLRAAVRRRAAGRAHGGGGRDARGEGALQGPVRERRVGHPGAEGRAAAAGGVQESVRGALRIRDGLRGGWGGVSGCGAGRGGEAAQRRLGGRATGGVRGQQEGD